MTSSQVQSALLAIAAIVAGTAATAQGQDSRTSAAALLNTPVTTQRIAGGAAPDDVKPPIDLDDPEAAKLGMQYFNQFNCAGCHAPNGAGGMGPSLSNRSFIYGREPANIFLTIQQGRPKGMPAWGELLTDDVIWRIVAYVRNISKAPETGWGRTISPAGFELEQVPAQRMESTTPWQNTQPFSYGQPPFERTQGTPPNTMPETAVE